MRANYIQPNYFYGLRFFLIFLMLTLAAMGVFAKRGLLDWRRMVRENRLLQGKIEEARKQKQELERQVSALQTNTIEQEYFVRRILGYVKRDETVIEFE